MYSLLIQPIKFLYIINFLQKIKNMYSSYNFMPLTYLGSNDYYTGLFEQMSYQMKIQSQEIDQLKKQNQELKELLENFQSQKVSKQSKSSATPQNQQSQEQVKRSKPKRTFYCEYDHCDRVYASCLALNLHIKNKHDGGTKKERDAYAKLIAMAQIKGEPIPQINFKFPRNYIENMKKKILEEMSFQKS